MGVLWFWLTALVIGALALPIAFRLLRRMPDAGTGLAMPLGLVLSGYAYFILRTLDVLPPGRGGYLLAAGLLAAAGVVVARTDRRFFSTLRRATPPILVLSGVFTLLFFGYVAFRAYQPDIAGTEQPMDFMYLNATLTSPDYPPQDPWLAGERASYYYFGYLQIGVLTSISDVPASSGYNFGLGYTFAAAGTAIASLAYAGARWVLGSRGRRWAIAAGGVAILFLLAVGSLSAIFEWAAAHGNYNRTLYDTFDVEWLIPCEPGTRDDCYTGQLNPRSEAWYPTEFWFWWRGSRIIPDTITEFPFFSFLLGDLHPHVTSIPLVLLTLGIAAAAWRGRSVLSLRTHLQQPAFLLLLAVVFGALAFANAWDLPTFSALFAVAVLARNLRSRPWPGAITATVWYLVPVFVLAVLAYLPWYLDFSSQANGLYPYVGEGTLPSHAFLQFGVLIAAALILLTWAWRRSTPREVWNTAVVTLWLPIIPLVAWMVLAAARGELQDGIEARSGLGWGTLVGYGAITWMLATAAVAMTRRGAPGASIGVFAAAGVLLLFGAELFYIGDIFEATPRLNTVFKLTYQAWILLSLAGAVALVVGLRQAARERIAAGWLAAPAGGLAVAGLVYALIALPNRTDGFDKETATDGLSFLARDDPAEYALTRWVQENTSADDVIVEASGRRWGIDAAGALKVIDGQVDYTDASRMSARTGRAAPIGWYFHEIQWRGAGTANKDRFAALQDLADRVYLSRDAVQSLAAIRALGARYVIVGSVELARFPNGSMAPFADFLDLVYQAGDLAIYEVPQSEVIQTS